MMQVCIVAGAALEGTQWIKAEKSTVEKSTVQWRNGEKWKSGGAVANYGFLLLSGSRRPDDVTHPTIRGSKVGRYTDVEIQRLHFSTW